MRKIVKFSVAFVLLALCIVLICAVSLPIVGFAEAQTTKAANNEMSAFVEELSEHNAEGDKSGARQFIANKFRVALGETPVDYENGASSQNDSKVEELYFSANQQAYFNIQAKLEGKDSSKQIIIGAHYDSVGAGAGDNACGVAVLYQTLRTLYAHKKDLPYNVVFVAFDGEEDGLLGSNHYVNRSMSEEDVANTLVMFNVDSIIHGDNLYLMCENKSTDLANLILSKSDGITEKPYARGTNQELYASFGYGYYEFVQGSDHTPFRLAGIPIAFFFSGSYSLGSWNFDAGDVINTSGDTYANLPSNFTDRIQTVSEAISGTVLSNEFVDVAANARGQLVNLKLWYNYLWPTIIVGVILVALVVATIFYNRKLQKNAVLGTAEIKSQKVFDKPSAEDIFTFKDDADRKNNADVDDIFTFKK